MKKSYFRPPKSITEALAQLVRASDCGSEGRGFEPHMPPTVKSTFPGAFYYYIVFGKNSLIVVPLFRALFMVKPPSTRFNRSFIIR